MIYWNDNLDRQNTVPFRGKIIYVIHTKIEKKTVTPLSEWVNLGEWCNGHNAIVEPIK